MTIAKRTVREPLRDVGQLAERTREITTRRDTAIRAAYKAGATYRSLAAATGLSPAGIGRIVKRG